MPTTRVGSHAVTIEAPETKIAETSCVACDRGEDVLWHPCVRPNLAPIFDYFVGVTNVGANDDRYDCC